MILTPPPEILEASSEAITAQSGSNLALAFVCLPPDRRRGMSIFYAFCRVIDDAADSETLTLEEKRGQLNYWREEIRRAYLSTPESALGREMAEIIRTYLIPPTPLEEILNGVEMDLSIRRYKDFPALQEYCYRVASAVGLVSIEIFSYRQTITRDYAISLGLAFQLTNILRDICKDGPNDRIYIPLDEMHAHGVTEEDILLRRNSPAMRKLLRFQYHRAKHYFSQSLRMIHPDDRPNLAASEIMREVYETLLEKIKSRGFELHDPPLRLNKASKALCILKARRREKRRLPLPPPPKHVLVLGGGLAGLSSAFHLGRMGHRVTLLESKASLGGRTFSFPHPKTGEILDNGQHILMGCYHESLEFLNELSVLDKLRIDPGLDLQFFSRKGFSRLRTFPLPSPFHLLGGLFGFRELTLRDRFSALRLGVQLKFGAPPSEQETAHEWLSRSGQTANLIRALWEPLCLAALNQDLGVCSARLLHSVLQLALFSSARDASIILSRVGLTSLFGEEVSSVLSMCEGSIRLKTQINQIQFSADRVTEVLSIDGQSFTADHVVSALPWNALRPLIPGESELGQACRQLEDSAIVSVYFWFDRPLGLPIVQGFLDSPLHWLFNRELIEGRLAQPGEHPYVAVISNANAYAETSSEELESMILSEIRRFVPAARGAQVVRRFPYKARSATFSATPSAELLRPTARTAWQNFWLAGDWTRTGLPATIEGAVLSGRLAAEAVDASH